MKVCSVCQRCCEDIAADCQENHGSLKASRSGSRQITADYRLDFLLGRDAAGETYQAARSGFDESFDIKIIAPNLIDSAARREEMQSEAQAAAALNHPNLARVYESGSTADGEFYVVSEAVGGQTLRECLRNVGALPEAEAVTIAERAAGALAAAHAVGVIHRAVSPANIILGRDGQKLSVKLRNFDFGGVGQQSAVAAFSADRPPIDELRYLAPEQCAGQTADARADIYSLAVVFYETLCGRSPFGAPTPEAIAERRINEQPLEKLGFDTRALLKHILHQSLQKRPEARPATAANFARQLRHIEQLLGLPGATAREVSQPSTPDESAAIASNNPPRSEAVEPPPAKYQAREMTARKFAGPIFPTIPVTARLSAEKIRENAVEENAVEENANDFAAPFVAPEPPPIEETAAELFAAEPILIRKKEASDSSIVSEPAFAEKEFAAAPIIVKRKQAALEPAPVFIGEKTADISDTPEIIDAPEIINAPEIPEITGAPEIINLRGADVGETPETRPTAPIFAGSLNESRVRPVTIKRSFIVSAGILALLASVMLGALLYQRQRQSSAAQPVIAAASPAPTAARQTEETASDTSGAAISDAAELDAAESNAAKTEKPAPGAVEKLPRTTASRENQPLEQTPAVNAAAKQTESPKSRAPRENPPAEIAAANTTRPRIVSGEVAAQGELNASLADWVTATNSRNVDRQMTYYAPKVNSYYRTRNASPDSVRAEKRRVFERADRVDIQAGKPEISVSPDGKNATMRFRKKYAISEGQKSRSGEVLQELQWVKSGSGWRIVSERDVKVLNH